MAIDTFHRVLVVHDEPTILPKDKLIVPSDMLRHGMRQSIGQSSTESPRIAVAS